MNSLAVQKARESQNIMCAHISYASSSQTVIRGPQEVQEGTPGCPEVLCYTSFFCAAEPKDAGMIPGHGGRFYDEAKIPGHVH